MVKQRVTIKELSKIMGVSPTTIANALNGQPKVSSEKRAEIISKAKEMGYKPNVYARAMVKNGIKLGILCAREPKENHNFFFKGIEDAKEEYSDIKLMYEYFMFESNRSEEEVLQQIIRVADSGVDGIAFSPSFHREKYEKEITSLIQEKGVPVVFSPATFKEGMGVASIYVDAVAMGRMAAQILGIACKAGSEIAVITTIKQQLPHVHAMLAVKAFTEFGERYGFHTVGIMENNDSPEITYRCAKYLVSAYPNLQAIYVTSYNTIPVRKCLEEEGLLGTVKIVGHDVFPEIVPYLKDGSILATLFQNPIYSGKLTVKTLVDYIIGEKHEYTETVIRPEIVMNSNIDCYEELYKYYEIEK